LENESPARQEQEVVVKDMPDQDRKKKSTEEDAGRRPSENDQLDRELDAALAKYAAIEPRAGLEERVLSNLQAEREHLQGRSWLRSIWKWSAAAAFAVAVVVVALLWRSEKPTHPLTATHPPIATRDAQTPERSVVLSGGQQVPPATPHPAMMHVTHRARPQVAAAPKLDQFPSPQPLTEQEQILADYVTHFHHQAVLVARVRNEELERDRRAVNGTPEVADETIEITSR
jgi:hypothetical protein